MKKVTFFCYGASCAIMFEGLLGMSMPVQARTRVPATRQTRVVLTQEKFTTGDRQQDCWQDFEEWDGDLRAKVWDDDVLDYVPTTLDLHGTGAVYREDWEKNDDGVVGDIYDAIVETQGTADPSDDVLHLTNYVGYVVFD